MKKGTVACISVFAGGAAGVALAGGFSKKTICEKDHKIHKFKTYYNMLNQWLILRQENKGLAVYFEKNGIHSIAIYGMGEMGNRLYEELKNTEIEIKYCIDKSAYSSYVNLRMIDLEDDFENVDAIIVTAVFDFEEIQKKLEEKTDNRIISLEDVIFEV